MKSNKSIRLFAFLLATIVNHQICLGQDADYKLQLGESDTDEVKLMAAGLNEYVLRIFQRDAQLLENISLKMTAAKEPVLKKEGNIIINYPNENLHLIMAYTADDKGYRVAYRIAHKDASEQVPVDFGVRLNIKDLKSLTG